MNNMYHVGVLNAVSYKSRAKQYNKIMLPHLSNNMDLPEAALECDEAAVFKPSYLISS